MGTGTKTTSASEKLAREARAALQKRQPAKKKPKRKR
jgi:hypothetical protein